MKFKFISFLSLMLALILAVSGCGNEETSQSTSTPAADADELSSEESSELSSEDDSTSEEDSASREIVASYNDTVGNVDLPAYFRNCSTSSNTIYFYSANNLECSYNSDGYMTLTAQGEDPFVSIKAPQVMSLDMRYVAIEYRTTEVTPAMFYVNRSDGRSMGEEGTYVSWSWNPTGEFEKIIIDLGDICAEGMKFTGLRIDPATSSDAVVDIKYIAGFKTKEEAEAFDIKKYDFQRLNVPGDVEWPDPEYKEQETTDADNYEGTLDIKDNNDGTVTISYVKDGKTVSNTVPNNANYTSGGFAGVDDLGRTVPNSDTVGIYGSNGEYYVGMFYFLWLGEHGDMGLYDINKIIAKYGYRARFLSCGAWGIEDAWHFFAEPLYGYYFSNDEWVIRKHMELLSNANVDFLYFDVTNGAAYVSNAKKVMKVCHQLNTQGYDAPQIVFYTNTSSASVVATLYKEIYAKEVYPDTWFMIDGKPVIVAPEEANINGYFTTKNVQWPTEETKNNAWPWIDFEWPQRVYTNNEGVGEAINVSVAQHSGSVVFSASAFYSDKTNRGRSTVGKTEQVSSQATTEDSYKYGYNFEAQWNRVFECIEKSKTDVSQSVKYVLVTGWNEWVAQRQSPELFPGVEIAFIDTCTPEYSRDLEMARGLYFDNYYIQLLMNISKLKGSAPVIIQDSRKAINVTGDFSQWDSVKVTYQDPKNDCDDRNGWGFGATEYVNYTGRNDIVSAKVTSDTKNLYFYVETAGDISMFDTDSSWMQLFVNTDGNGKNGWYGYDYIINHEAKSAFTTTVAKNNKKGEFSFETVGEVSYRVKDNKMMISVPLEMLNITDYTNINIEFKWADSVVKIENMEAFYELGDAAPLGRLNFIYRNK